VQEQQHNKRRHKAVGTSAPPAIVLIALTTVHSLYLMDLDTKKEGSKLPQTLPLSYDALSPGQMQYLVRSFRPRMLVSLPAGAPHDVIGEQLKLKLLLRNNAGLWNELVAQAAKHASAKGFDECWGPLRTSFLPCVCLRAGLCPCFQEARR
jgi:hypothetical protein